MDTTTRSEFDISRLRRVIAAALKLPDTDVIGGWLPEDDERTRFITVDVISQTEIGTAKRCYDGKTETITSSLMSTVSLSCYGNNALRVTTKLKTVMQSSRMIDALKAMNAGIVRFSDVRNLTSTIGAEYEERGQFDCTISHNHIIETPLEPIEQVDVHTNQKLTNQIRRNP